MKKGRKTRSRAMALTSDMREAILNMPDERTAGELARAIMEYAFHETECESDNELVRAELERLRPQIDQSVTPEAIKDAGYTRWGDIKATIRSWIFRVRLTLIRKFGKKVED